MKILYISPRYDGGIGGHAKRVAEKLQANGFNVELMRVPYIQIKKLKNPSFTLFGSLKAMMNKTEYDIVHAWNVPSAFIMKNINAKKKVLSIHGIYSQQIEMIHSSKINYIGKMAERKALELADVFTSDSKIVCNFYKQNYAKNFIYLPAPLDTEKFNSIPSLDKIKQIIYVGRDSYEKGIDILKNIENKINCKVVYCTNSPWKDTMIELKRSSAIIVPSRIESIPQIIKEAYFLKIPVIATNVGGVPEIVENNITGILIPPNNPEIMLKTINKFLEQPAKYDKMIKTAFEFVNKNFSWDNLLPNYISFYNDLLHKS